MSCFIVTQVPMDCLPSAAHHLVPLSGINASLGERRTEASCCPIQSKSGKLEQFCTLHVQSCSYNLKPKN
jgi:hypothetical protein